MMPSANPRKKAIFVINSLAGGGAERIMTTLLRGSAPWRDRFDISLILLDREPEAYSVPDWVDIVQLDSRGGLLSGVLSLRRVLVQAHPDVTLSFLTRANICNIVATWGLRARCIISERVNSSAHFSGRLGGMISKWLVRVSYPRADHVIAVSSGVAHDLARNFAVQRRKISVIANPVDHQLIKRLSAEAPEVPVEGEFIVASGRLVPNKNFPMLIEAFAGSGLPGSLVILGEGPERPRLEEQIARLGLGERVLLPGFVQNPFAVIKRATLFALPSNAEGFPNGLVEAMACGLPVVATNCASGPSEIMLNTAREAVRGLVPCEVGAIVPTNETSAFTAALRLVHDPDTRALKGAAAAASASKFNIGQTTKLYWDIIDRMSARNNNRAVLAHGHESAMSR
ncbi:MAG: glycosyltransferase [Novosphingobium sp.]